MTTFDPTMHTTSAHAAQAPVLPLLGEMPKLLEYRSESDPDAEFIPKTVAGFALGAISMFICLVLLEGLVFHRAVPLEKQSVDLTIRFAFMLGITGVACSLLLVGLKVRADHSVQQLFARHWLNSIATGALYAVMLWAPWLLMSQFFINRFIAAGVWMLLMAFPAIAARWTIGPQTCPAR